MQLHAQLTIDTSARLESNPGIYSLLVSQNDHIVYERYFKQYTTDTLFSDQSLTKSTS